MKDTNKDLQDCRYTVLFLGKGSNNKRAMSYTNTYRDFLFQKEIEIKKQVNTKSFNVIPFPTRIAY